MNHLPVYSRPFDDDDFEELSLDDEHVELASELREYSEDDYDDEFTEQERRELVIAPLTPPRPATAPPTLRAAKVASRIELEPPPPPAFALGPGQLPPRPAKFLPPVKKAAAPAKKPSAAVKKAAVPAKKVAGAKKTTSAVKAAVAPPVPAKKIAAKKVAPAKKAPAEKK